MSLVSVFAFIGLTALQASPQATPPIFNPGAPGAPSRVISAAEALALGRTSHTADDTRFMQHMIVHHAQAVEMVALLNEHGQDQRVRRLGERIAASQQAEIELMQGWLESRGEPLTTDDLHAGHGATPAASGHDHHAGHEHHAGHGAPAAASETPLMPGMLSPAQMQRLAAARGPAFDTLFLTGMVQHHQGALDMVDELLAKEGAAEDTLLSDFTGAVVADQSAEILRMQSLLSELNP